MAENKVELRNATKEDYAIGLPKTKAEAIERGITRFNPGDEKGERIIRNYGSKKFPKGVIATATNRKTTRGGGSQGTRLRNEKLSTPPGANQKAFATAMITARQMGLVGDHNYSVARTGNALAEMTPTEQKQYHQTFKAAGIAIGNQSENITPITEELNQAKVGQERALDKNIQSKVVKDYQALAKKEPPKGSRRHKRWSVRMNHLLKQSGLDYIPTEKEVVFKPSKNGKNGKRTTVSRGGAISTYDFVDQEGRDLSLSEILSPDDNVIAIPGAPLFMKI